MPPPPPGPPPPPMAVSAPPPASKDRNKLLSDITKGKKLNKVVTKDRSAPLIDAPKSNSTSALNSSTGGNSTGPQLGGPQLGGLFAGGMPKLKKAGETGPPSSNNNFRPPPTFGSGPPSFNKPAQSSVPSSISSGMGQRGSNPSINQPPVPSNISRNNVAPAPTNNFRPPPVMSRDQPQTMPKAPVPPPIMSRDTPIQSNNPPTMSRSGSGSTERLNPPATSSRPNPPPPVASFRAPPAIPPQPLVDNSRNNSISADPTRKTSFGASGASKFVPPPAPSRGGMPAPSRSSEQLNTSNPTLQKNAPPIPMSSRQAPQNSSLDSFASPAPSRPAPPSVGARPVPPSSAPLMSSRQDPITNSEPSGRWNFHSINELPNPRNFVPTRRVYPSGALTGSSISKDILKKGANRRATRAAPPPPISDRVSPNGSPAGLRKPPPPSRPMAPLPPR